MRIRIFAVFVVVALMATFLVGAGNISAYRGNVKSVRDNKIVIALSKGNEKTFRTTAKTEVFLEGSSVTLSHIRRNMRVLVNVDNYDVCRRIVVEEVPQ